MTANKKPAAATIRKAGYMLASDSRKNSPFRSILKALIVRLAVCGLLPIPAADWIISRGLRHD